MIYTAQSFSSDTGVSLKLAKRILDLLDSKNLDPMDLNALVWRLRDYVSKAHLPDIMESLKDDEITPIIDQMIIERAKWDCPADVCCAETEDELKAAFNAYDAECLKLLKKEKLAVVKKSKKFDGPESAWFFTALEKKKGEYKEGDIVTIQIFRTGKWEHPGYGTVEITTDTIKDVVQHFANRTRGVDLCVDENHEPDHKALGWFREVYSEDKDQKCFAKIELTKKGADLLNEGAYKYFSPEIIFHKIDEESGDEQSNLLIGGAFTNRPFFKGMQSLMASENAAGNVQSGRARTKVGHALFFSHTSMKKFFDVLAKLADKSSISASEKAELEQVYSEIAEANRNDAVKKAFAEMLARFDEGEGNPPAPTPTESDGDKPTEIEEKGEDEEDDEVPTEETPVVPEGVDGVQANEDGTFKITDAGKFAESIKGIQTLASNMQREATLAACEKSVAPLVFSEKRKDRVVLPKQRKKIVQFAASLSEKQRGEFFSLLGELKSVPAGELGTSKDVQKDITKPETFSAEDPQVQFFMEKMHMNLETAQKATARYYAEKNKRA